MTPIPAATNGRTLPPDSRIYLLGDTAGRRLARWGAMPPAAEGRVILALAADTLPDPFPPTREETALARTVKRLFLPRFR